MKIQKNRPPLSLSDEAIHLRKGQFLSDVEVVTLHPTKRTH